MTIGATATVKGGLFHQYSGTLSPIGAVGPLRRIVAQTLGKKGALAVRQLMRALDGVAAGATATKTYARIENNVELGGKRTIESQSMINRATVAGDVTAINADMLALTSMTHVVSPVANKDGNPLGTR